MPNAMQALIVAAAGAVLPESVGQQQQDLALMDAQLDLGGGYIAEDPSNWLLSVRCLTFSSSCSTIETKALSRLHRCQGEAG